MCRFAFDATICTCSRRRRNRTYELVANRRAAVGIHRRRNMGMGMVNVLPNVHLVGVDDGEVRVHCGMTKLDCGI